MQQLPTSELLLVKTRKYGLLILLVTLLGVLYYPLFRPDALPWVLRAFPGMHGWYAGDWWSHRLATMATDYPALFYLNNSLPSLIHGYVSVLSVYLATAWLPQVSRTIWLLLTLVVVALCELCIGWFSWLDMLALALGAGVAQRLATSGLASGKALSQMRKSFVPTDKDKNSTALTGISPSRIAMSALVAGSSFIAIGSYVDGYYSSECARYDEQGYCEEYKLPGVPIYMTYVNLRNSVAIEAARPLDRIGRVYLYQELVFLNERNEGIHIINNSNPSAPENLGFIRIPGNTEIAVRGNYLYADSYVDLITLDLSDPDNITLINRQEDIFPYDAFQNIPNNVSFSRVDINPLRGVVVSYRLSES